MTDDAGLSQHHYRSNTKIFRRDDLRDSMFHVEENFFELVVDVEETPSKQPAASVVKFTKKNA
ncbi:uncharacterized protein BDCG_16250 [Blastomyces dermatitidis ER-3]|uniref:Uncharacterized protein n=1 Tax=Ajellomyces dermatitidis (strain ER-3 / ATCC MYA-2586) TaxID=559297 RepID=A0ABX2VRT5_AJEDR|nr:uncharacterized protein BDCG_16250 [Blastomyces dermatitidis ER-3]OAS99666.1 hypothetical protein BDCG_16250 [Blastomyces dermatitidis ER-3]